jgi:hypothetical protein
MIAPGSATFPGGSRTGCVSVTPVNMDKVPMSPGFGQQPRFIVTIQPVGTRFNPPARMTMPNVDGLAPRSVTEMYSYDHDLASFVAIGSATVSGDGSTITSDLGSGVIKAGWHCGGNPNSSGSAGTCQQCWKCVGSDCKIDFEQNGRFCTTILQFSGRCTDGHCNAIGQLKIELPTKNQIFRISDAPTMPAINATANILEVQPDPTSTTTFSWTLDITYTGPDGRTTMGSYSTTSNIGGRWNPYDPTTAQMRGGDAALYASAQREQQTLADHTSGIRVLGTNPSRTDVNGLLGGFPATNIACWESLHRLAQFASDGLPLFGGPHGYGVMQLDNPPVSEDGIWNWRTNVADGLALIAQKQQDANGYPARTRARLNNPQIPDFCMDGTIDPATGQQMCMLEGIQRYNGGAYWQWDPIARAWIANPLNDYVTNVLQATCN